MRTVLLLMAMLGELACGRRPPEPESSAPRSTTPAPAPQIDDRAEWTTSLGTAGSVRLRWRGVDLMRMEYPFWADHWSWADPQVIEGEADAHHTTFRIEIPAFESSIEASAQVVQPGVLEVQYTARVGRDLDGMIGGGPEFHLRSDVLADQPGFSPPQLLPNHEGFRWTAADDQTINVRFSPPAARVFFEQNRREQIRAFILGPETKAGTHRVTMRVELPPQGIVEPSLTQRYSVGQDPWFPATFQWDQIPVDLRHLNDGHRPAGIHGPIHTEGDRLVFKDGTPARFWGTNVTAYSLFSIDEASIVAQAQRIAALGFNLVRIHHHDSHWVEPNIFVAGANETQSLSASALEKLDRWVQALQNEGVYIWLDLHVGRRLRDGDQVPGFSELAARERDPKGFNYVNPRIEALMQDFARRYLRRTNRYTHRRYVDDPGVIGVLITNENDLTHHFGNLMNKSQGTAQHRAMLKERVAPFARAHNLPLDSVLEPWSYGPAKIAMNELEARYHLRFIAFLRRLGLRTPIATTNFWGDDPMASLPALTVGDVLDIHSYGGEGELDIDPRASHNFIHRIAAGRVEGMPTIISEWNLLPPVRDRFVGPMWMAAIASLQGWEAPMHYCYTATPLPPPEQLYESMGLIDPATVALMPAAAVAFRQGHIQAARQRYRIVLDRQSLYHREMGAHRSAAIRTLSEQSRVQIALPDIPELQWDTPRPVQPGAIEVHDLNRSFVPADAHEVISDTGEIRRDWSTGVGTIDTPRTQAAYGWIGGQTISLSDVELTINTPKATVVVTALDNQPIRRSKDLMVSVAAQVDSSSGRRPLKAQAVSGHLRIRSELEHRVIRSTTHAGGQGARAPSKPQPGTRTGDAHSFVLKPQPTHWYRITPP